MLIFLNSAFIRQTSSFLTPLLCTTDSFPGTQTLASFTWETLKLNRVQHFCESAPLSSFSLHWLWRLTVGDTCGIFLSGDIFHDGWVARSTDADGNTAAFHFQSRKCVCVCVCVCVCGEVGGAFHAPGVKLTSHLQYGGITFIQHGCRQLSPCERWLITSHIIQAYGPFSTKGFTTHPVQTLRDRWGNARRN